MNTIGSFFAQLYKESMARSIIQPSYAPPLQLNPYKSHPFFAYKQRENEFVHKPGHDLIIVSPTSPLGDKSSHINSIKLYPLGVGA